MRVLTVLLGIVAFNAGGVSPAQAQRFSFERSFDVSGPSALDVSTIRGKIEVTVGEPGRIVVAGTATVRVDWNVPANAAELARRVADNPPIQREGQTLKLRPPSDAAELRAVTVAYQVRVPPDTDVTTVTESGATSVRGVSNVSIRTQSASIEVMQLKGTAVVTTGSGSLTVDDVAGSLTATTSSSSITARAIGGNLRVRTQSGAVNVVLSGEGDADVKTGSSAIRLSGIRGAVVSATESGHTTIQGEPRRDWMVTAGSGSVDIVTPDSVPFTLDASSGGGSVKVIGPAVQGSVAKRNVAGTIAGGGPLMKVAIRSGSIVIRVGADSNP